MLHKFSHSVQYLVAALLLTASVSAEPPGHRIVTEPLVFRQGHIANPDEILVVRGGGSISINTLGETGTHNAVFQSIRVWFPEGGTLKVSGSRLLILNLMVEGGTVEFSEMHNSTVIGCNVSRSKGDGIRIVGNCGNNEISCNPERCEGYGVVIDGKVRSLELTCKPAEASLKGQVLVRSMDPRGDITISGRLNRRGLDVGVPLTIEAKAGDIYLNCFLRNLTDEPAIVYGPEAGAKLYRIQWTQLPEGKTP